MILEVSFAFMATLHTMFKQKANSACNNKAFRAVSLLRMADDYDRLFLAAQLLHPEEHIDGPSALGRFLGELPQAMTNWKSRGVPKSKIGALARRIGCRAEYLEFGDGPMKAAPMKYEAGQPLAPPAAREPSPDFVPVRRVRLKVSAGVTGFSVEPLNGDGLPIFFRADWLASKRLRADKLVAVRVNGDSMAPGLYDGDLVVINTDDATPKDGEVFVVNYEGEAVIKRMRRDGGLWWLASDNPDKTRYADKRCDEHAVVVGRVIYKQSEHI